VQYARDFFHLGALATQTGDMARAERHIRAAQEKLERLYGQSHPLLATCRRNLALVLLGWERPGEALELLRSANVRPAARRGR
jgi:hypothetical protein